MKFAGNHGWNSLSNRNTTRLPYSACERCPLNSFGTNTPLLRYIMFRMLSALPITLLLVAAAPLSAAPRPDEKPNGPAIVGQAKSLNDLLEIAKTMVKNVGGEALYKEFEQNALSAARSQEGAGHRSQAAVRPLRDDRDQARRLSGRPAHSGAERKGLRGHARSTEDSFRQRQRGRHLRRQRSARLPDPGFLPRSQGIRVCRAGGAMCSTRR